MDRPKGHGDFDHLIHDLFGKGQELREVGEQIEQLQAHPGWEPLKRLLSAKDQELFDRFMLSPPEGSMAELAIKAAEIRSQILGLRSGLRAAESIRFEAEQSRRRAAEAVERRRK